MNPVVFNLIQINVNDFENVVDELQELCTAVQMYYRYRYSCTDTGVPLDPDAPELSEIKMTLISVPVHVELPKITK